jgi:quercetin dioxygenase-like cupin family protein
MRFLRVVLLAAASVVAATVLVVSSHAKGPAAPDPTATDPDKYHLVFENACVRILRYSDGPGEKTQLHHHPNPFALYALAPFSRTLTFADGKKAAREFKAGDVIWVPPQTHIGENTGTTPSDALLFERKNAACAAP